jgi:hypothetical protein
MKPTFLTACSHRPCDPFHPAPRKPRRLPITDYSYQAVSLEESSGRYMRYPSPSFWKIADGYLKGEARHDFQREGVLFAMITVTAALPLMNNVHALIEFVRAVTSH